MTRIQEFETSHHDQITVVDHNFTGKRMLTASADHRVKVYERATLDSKPVLKDTWTAHNADIRDAKWFHPTLGTHIATISNDLTLKIWGHDPSQAPNSGRTFRRITTISSHTGVPFVSLSIKHMPPATTYLAVIDRIGNLSIYTPASPETFSDWAPLCNRFNVCDGGAPPRTTETSFSVAFDQNVNSVPYILNLPQSSQSIISLAVSALDHLKVYRSDPTAPNIFQEVARSPSHQSLIRSIAWSNGNIRGYDILATGSSDGTVRFFDLHTTAAPSSAAKREPNPGSAGQSHTNAPSSAPSSSQNYQQQHNHHHTPQSSLTTAIAGRTASNASTSAPTSAPHQTSSQRLGHSGPFATTLTLTNVLEGFHRDCLAIRFDPTGSLLASMDADGGTVYWKKSVDPWTDDSSYDDRPHPEGVVDSARKPASSRSEWIVFAREEVGDSEDEAGGDGDGGDGSAGGIAGAGAGAGAGTVPGAGGEVYVDAEG